MSHPTVSIIMSVYNGEQYLSIAIDSILNQTFTDFEFVIINDYSTDQSKAIIQSYADERIVYLENEKNIGLAASLNKGIAIAKGKYIARMDDDDVAFPERLQRQVAFLEENREIGLLGTYAEIGGKQTGLRKHSEYSDELKVRTFFSCQFCHPTVMIRKEVLDQNNLRYNEAFSTAQDYDLWSRMLKCTDFATLPDVLLKYRTHDKQVSVSKRQLQIEATTDIYEQMVSSLNLQFTEEMKMLHRKVAVFQFLQAKQDVPKIGDYFQQLIEANNKLDVFPKLYFARFLSEYYYNIVNKTETHKLLRLKLYSPFFQSYFYPYLGKIKQLLK